MRASTPSSSQVGMLALSLLAGCNAIWGASDYDFSGRGDGGSAAGGADAGGDGGRLGTGGAGTGGAGTGGAGTGGAGTGGAGTGGAGTGGAGIGGSGGGNGGAGGDLCGTQAILDDGPVLYWRLGETNGSVAADISGNGQDGVYNGVVLGVPGVSWDGDTAVELAGNIGSFVQLFPVGPFPTNEFTIEFWVRTIGSGDDYGMISYASNQSDNDIYVDDAPSLDLMVDSVNLFSNVNVSDGQWHHVAVTWRSSDGRARFFLDGSLALSQTGYQAGVVLSAAGSLVLGQDQDSIGGGFSNSQAHEGALDEVIVFDQDLDESRIAAHRAAIECP